MCRQVTHLKEADDSEINVRGCSKYSIIYIVSPVQEEDVESTVHPFLCLIQYSSTTEHQLPKNDFNSGL